jgi:hypothetical protein
MIPPSEPFRTHLLSHQFPQPAPAPKRDSPPANAAPRIQAPTAQDVPSPNSPVRTCLYLMLSRLPEAPLLRRANFRPRPLPRRSGKAVKMPRRTSGRFRLFPARFEPAQFLQPHQNRIKRPGRDAGVLAQRIPVLPLSWPGEQSIQHRQCLPREPNTQSHALTLYR